MSDYPEMSDRRDNLAKALVTIRSLRNRLETYERAESEPVAIVGLGCRFPGGANSPEAYWDLLTQRVDAISEVPADRWPVDEYYHPDPDEPGKSSTRWGGFLDQVDRFDASFFGISRREAERIDPQHRLLLEVVWEALERGGIAPDSLSGSSTGIFVGITTNEYLQRGLKLLSEEEIDAYLVASNTSNAAPGRVAYTLGLQGPSVAIDTACSSSLVAVHLACQSLRAGDCSMAIAAGVNVLLAPETYISFSRWGMMARDGRCKTFDARADGFVRGEGCGVVILKRLSDAMAAGDNILAVVRGSAVNQDGPSSGLTVPNGLAQADLLRLALQNARLRPADVDFVEAHGTGTKIGDPIEVEALDEVYGENREATNPLLIGSVKTNVGHLESASGVAGLIKIVLALQKEEIPPQIHFEQPTPHIPWDAISVRVAANATPWRSGEKQRIAGVSGFGFSGTNAHVILEEAPRAAEDSSTDARPRHLLLLSAKSGSALRQMAAQLADHLDGHPDLTPQDVCATLNVGRARFPHRLALVGSTTHEFAEGLREFASGNESGLSGAVRGSGRPKLAFLFTGQGSQYVGMGRSLYESEPVFRLEMDRCNELFQARLGRSVLDLILASDPESKALLEQTQYTQPALFMLEWSLAAMWRSWGVLPSAVAGHSLGEITAAAVANVLSLESAVGLVAERARLMGSAAGDGSMAAVMASREEVEAVLSSLDARVEVAAENGPHHVVISGASAAVERVRVSLEVRGLVVKPLVVSHAFHSSQMDEAATALGVVARTLPTNRPTIEWVSTVRGESITAPVTPAHWEANVRGRVRYAHAIEALWAKGYRHFVEIGPHPVLLSMAREVVDDPAEEAHWLPTLRRGANDWDETLRTLGEMYVAGVEVDWKVYQQSASGKRVSLPTYPFERERYWIEEKSHPRRRRTSASTIHPLLGERIASPLKEILFEQEIAADRLPFLDDHRLYGRVVLPGTAYLETAFSGALSALEVPLVSLEHVQFIQALAIGEDESRRTQFIVDPRPGGSAEWKYYSTTAEGGWTLHAQGVASVPSLPASEAKDIDAVRARCSEYLSGADHYAAMHQRGFHFGESLHGVLGMWRQDGEALGQIQLPETVSDESDRYFVHPSLLDACLQVVAGALWSKRDADSGVVVPVAVERIWFRSRPGSSLWSHATLRSNTSPNERILDIQILDDSGIVIGALEGIEARPIAAEVLRPVESAESRAPYSDWIYGDAWVPADAPDGNASISGGRWLVFADFSGVGSAFVSSLLEQGASCVVAHPGNDFERMEENEYRLNPTRPEHFAELMEKVGRFDSVAYLWPLDGVSEEDHERLLGGGLHLVQALVRSSDLDQRRLLITTSGAQVVETAPGIVVPAQATVWGMGRVLALEHPELRPRIIDLDPSDRAAHALQLSAEARIVDDEDQVAYRAGERLVRRLERMPADLVQFDPAETKDDDDQSRSLEFTERGSFDALHWRSAARRDPGVGEVEVRIARVGLNFRDVLNVLGMYPGSPPLGSDSAGTVVRVGDGVDNLAVGDRVLLIPSGSFRTHVTLPTDFVFHLDEGISFEEAVTLPSAFLTAVLALENLAAIESGEYVLVHAAAGGVGMAAVQLALKHGAIVIGTAGSEEKRSLLRSMGVHHVFNSRSTSFADDIRNITGGDGVSVILNSLAGEFIRASLTVLRADGRFIEIGKRDILTRAEFEEERPDGTYHVLDVSEWMRDDPLTVRSAMERVLRDVSTGELAPLRHEVFEAERVQESFRHMARGGHAGKVVVTIPGSRPPQLVRRDGTYLITGGTRGLGLVVARWLVSCGAQHLVLLGRSVPPDDATESIDEMRAAGANVLVHQVDVSDAPAMERLFEQVLAKLPQIRGIVHAAGILDDATIVQQDWSRFSQVMAPKVNGALNLHRLSLDLPLDFFVLFSAGAASLGSRGQSNYAAANAYLDALAHLRRAQNLPGLSINWGPWSEVGMASDSAIAAHLAAQGFNHIAPTDGIRVLEALMRSEVTHAGVFAVPSWTHYADVRGGSTRLLSRLREDPRQDDVSRGHDTAPVAELPDPELPLDERLRLLAEKICEVSAAVLGIRTEKIDRYSPLNEQGLDSLLGVELRNRLRKSLALPQSLPATLVFDYPTIEAISTHIGTRVLGWTEPEIHSDEGDGASPSLKRSDGGNVLDLIEELSDDEVEKLLGTQNSLRRGL